MASKELVRASQLGADACRLAPRLLDRSLGLPHRLSRGRCLRLASLALSVTLLAPRRQRRDLAGRRSEALCELLQLELESLLALTFEQRQLCLELLDSLRAAVLFAAGFSRPCRQLCIATLSARGDTRRELTRLLEA